MVKRLLICLFYFFSLAAANDISVRTEINRDQQESRPVQGTITISHPISKIIDENSFQVKGKPINVALQHKLQISPTDPFTLSIYEFELKPYPQGAHLLPPITVSVDGKKYHSLPVAFKVEPTSPQTTTSKASFVKPTLKLELKVIADDPLYPGQRFKVIYRYHYQGEIQLSLEELPVLTDHTFTRIGEEQIRNFEEKGVTIREVEQEFEAPEVGEFTFEPSVIEGLAYGPTGKHLSLRSKVPPFTLVVSPLPTQKVPVTFSGAIGQFSISSKLLSPSDLTVGEKLTLAINIEGPPPQIDSLTPPHLFCQPGFSGMFQKDPSFSSRLIKRGKKQFIIELRPLHAEVMAIPPITFSSYNPSKKAYEEIHTASIPIKVKSLPTSPSIVKEETAALSKTIKKEWGKLLLQEQKNPLIPPSLNQKVSSPSEFILFWLLPFAALALLGQYIWQKRLSKKSVNTSLHLAKKFQKKCLQESRNQQRAAHYGYDAVTYFLHANGVLPNPSVTPKKMKKYGVDDSTIDFLIHLLEQQYGKSNPYTIKKIQEKVRHLK